MKSLIILLLFAYQLIAKDFRVASYNVENLFDLQRGGSEYSEYIPYTKHGWNKRAFNIKVNNIAQVICDMKPDIIGLQEIESDNSLKALQKALKRCGLNMPYRALADKKPTTVKNALLSKFRIVKKSEIEVSNRLKFRNILETIIDIDGRKLHIFVNHWMSKKAKESERVKSAKALVKRLKRVQKDCDYIILGDLNSDINEHKNFFRSRNNDTNGLTAINGVLKIESSKKNCKRVYDLWYDLPKFERWSHNFFGKKRALDHIIVSCALFDRKNIDYKDKTFRVFKKSYLFNTDGSINRWRVYRKKHLHSGYSDHLPIYADFTTKMDYKKLNISEYKEMDKKLKVIHVSDLYSMSLGLKNVTIPEAVVIYKKPPFAILKEPNNRAILVYKDVNSLKYSHKYKILVKDIYEYRGLREITKLKVLKDFGKRHINHLLLKNFNDLNKKEYVNEVVEKITGKYKDGYLHYKNGKKIKIYFKNSKLTPANNKTITLKHIRIGLYKNRPELVVE